MGEIVQTNDCQQKKIIYVLEMNPLNDNNDVLFEKINAEVGIILHGCTQWGSMGSRPYSKFFNNDTFFLKNNFFPYFFDVFPKL